MIRERVTDRQVADGISIKGKLVVYTFADDHPAKTRTSSLTEFGRGFILTEPTAPHERHIAARIPALLSEGSDMHAELKALRQEVLEIKMLIADMMLK